MAHKIMTATDRSPAYFICSQCGSKRTYFRRRSQSFVCQRCGASWPAPWVQGPKGKSKKAKP